MSSEENEKLNLNDSLKASPGRGGWRGPDINCDLGEGMSSDALIIPFITAANIACGYHAGDVATMQQTIEVCLKYQVAIGAHPSFYDKDNFGRTTMNLPPNELYDLLTQQLIILSEVADSFDQKINHVKPHGALYNLSAKDIITAGVIADAVKDFDASLILFGLSGSYSISEAKKKGLATASEVFADRTYQDDGSLTPRSQSNALIEETDKAVAQVLEMIKEGTVTSVSGKKIPIVAETICIHGDGKRAVEFAKAIHDAIGKLSG
jgi:5-oxoprolinase (ATP-hydrolysing) subunit A